jgi:MAF protein
MLPLILASSSPYRQALLARLGLPFTTAKPAIDETALAGEAAAQLVARLAEQKARAIPTTTTGELIIGSDQVASLNGSILTKPGNHSNACQQLQLCSANTVTFYTAIALLNSQTNRLQLATELYTVHFRALDDATIERYLQREQPYDCAGSFKMEGLGISLFQSLQGNDPNSLIGLPLIQLVNLLKKEGIAVP